MRQIALIIYDFDGVMTDNRVLIFKDGREAVFVNRADGLAIKAIKKMGIPQIIISTETNLVVKARAKKLGIPLMQSVEDKKRLIRRYLKDNKIKKEEVIFVGNDINDKEAMEFVGWPVAPVDAHQDIRKIARVSLSARGGYGVIRELLDKLKDL